MKAACYQIIFLYVVGIFFLYPILAHILMYQLGYMTDILPQGKFWLYTQIYISAPVLIILGLLLYFKYKGPANKVFGVLFLIIALYWIYNVVNDVIKETA
jgi:hypothetical protein